MSTFIKVKPPMAQWRIEVASINLLKIIKLWNERYQQRKQLVRLDNLQLKDIGISRSEAMQEAKKPFWK